MISKRYKRSSQPQEQLRQFSLNNSKGIDESKPITDQSTVVDSCNLQVNLDGSLSLRRPLRLVERQMSAEAVKDLVNIFHTHAPNVYVLQYAAGVSEDGTELPARLVLADEAFERLPFKLRFYTDKGSYTEWVNDTLPYLSENSFDITNIKVIPLSSATILGNVSVSFNSHILPASFNPFSPVLDPNLYDNPLAFVPRYLQIHYDNVQEAWYIDIKTPEVGTLTRAEGELSWDANLTLDNPYSLRDSTISTPSVKGIVAYALSTRTKDTVKYIPIYTEDKPSFGEDFIGKLTTRGLTESSKSVAYRPITHWANISNVILKAFCNIPSAYGTGHYCTWLRWNSQSPTGGSWECVVPGSQNSSVAVRVRKDTMSVSGADIKLEDSDSEEYETQYYVPLKALPYDTPLFEVPENFQDVSMLVSRNGIALYTDYGFTYMFKIISVEPLVESDLEFDKSLDAVQYRSAVEYGRAVYTPSVADDTEFVYTDFKNAVYGDKLYYKKSIYSYNDPGFKNNIFATYPGEFITPMSNTIDVTVTEDSYVTALVPWRDYLISATQYTINLHTPQANGWLTKTINAGIGIASEDSKCCISVLNGLIFKSGDKVYQIYPNLYSSDDTVLNLTDISKPVSSVLSEYAGTGMQFAFSTESEYVLMLPYDTRTDCLRYNYTSKLWTRSSYPVSFKRYKMYSVNDIRLIGIYEDGTCAEYVFDADIDYDDSWEDVVLKNNMSEELVPISFLWDTGQKTDSISNTRQFVESKIMFATLSERDSFPFTLYVAIDGDPHITKKDVSTDAPFWKTSEEDLGVFNTSFRLGTDSPVTSAFNTLRQLIVRYSGKGKSIRHVIEGESSYNFKLYETYIRYKNLNVKQ